MSLAHDYTLGIDGGGSKTAVTIIDDSERVIGRGLGGGTNTNFTNRRSAVAAFKRAIRQALAEAGLQPADITYAGSTFSMAAGQAFKDLGIECEPLQVGEPEVAFERAGIRQMRGIALIAGTGSSCFGYGDECRRFHSGGWGALLGDEGSAFDIGLRAIKRALAAMDGRLPETLLVDHLKSYFAARSLRDVINRCGIRINQPLVAGFATHTSEAAIAGDEAALEILKSAGEELGELAVFVARRVFDKSSEFPVVLAGGVFNAGSVVIDPIRSIFASQFPRAEVVVAFGEPGEAVARITRRKLLS